jgi:hypothetical protein
MRATRFRDYAPVDGRLMIRWAAAYFAIQPGMQEPESAPTKAKRKAASPAGLAFRVLV